MPTNAPAPYHVDLQDVSARTLRGTISALTMSGRPGEAIALLGGLGAGKTTVLQILAGHLQPEAGYVRLFGKQPGRVARRVGFSREHTPLSPLFSPNHLLNREAARRGVPAGQRPSRVAEAIDLLGLYEQRDRPLRELSAGERAAVGLATAIVHRPLVLLLDNPMGLLPEPLAERVWEYLHQRQSREGLTVVYSTVRSGEAERADRVLLLDQGRPLAFGAPPDLLAHVCADTITVEAAAPEAVQRTIRGVFDVEVEETRHGVRFSARDGAEAAAHLLRHPPEGARAVYVRPPTLWDVIEALKERGAQAPKRATP